MPNSQEGNQGTALHWPCVTDLSGFSIYRFKDLWKEDGPVVPVTGPIVIQTLLFLFSHLCTDKLLGTSGLNNCLND